MRLNVSRMSLTFAMTIACQEICSQFQDVGFVFATCILSRDKKSFKNKKIVDFTKKSLQLVVHLCGNVFSKVAVTEVTAAVEWLSVRLSICVRTKCSNSVAFT